MAATVEAAPWPADVAASLERSARQMFYGDDWHNSGGCRREGRLGRENCGVCCLLGYEPRGGFGDGYSVRREGPNYSGWARLYVEARRPIPAKWREAFRRELARDANHAYADALARSVVTFGARFSR